MKSACIKSAGSRSLHRYAFAALLAVSSTASFADSVVRTAAPAPMLLAQAAAKAPATDARATQAALEALIKAAKAEGEVRFYTAATENVGKRIVDALFAKYGIKGQFVRINSIGLQQRFAAEAEVGTYAVDVLLNSGDSVSYAQNGIKRGWIDSLTSANLPVLTSGEYPARFNREVCAVIQISPWSITYNTDKVKGADVPKDWPDMLNPKWKGQILAADPRSSDAYTDHWTLLFDKYGEAFFARLREQNIRFYSSGVPALQSLAAGEGSIMVPVVLPQFTDVQQKGAPVAFITPDTAVGNEIQVTLVARAKAKNPNAARLMANYVMSQEGNKVVNDDRGSTTVYDTAALPKDYRSAKPGTSARRPEVLRILGVQ